LDVGVLEFGAKAGGLLNKKILFFNIMKISFRNNNFIELGFVVEHRVDPGMNLY
jgi:WD40 repeat protein